MADTHKRNTVSNYPVSMVDELDYTKKVNQSLRNIIIEHEKIINEFKTQQEEQVALNDSSEDALIWRWQGDGYDYTTSMVSDQLILMRADELRQLMGYGEILAEEESSGMTPG